ncbi:MAG: hypothetical protein R3183_04885 [Oleiphilaceae bacterium]|nr:hypothetical protein [Oleiphilaceae bacterium]
MAIYDHKYGELKYYRVFRAWGGEEYQEYVRIKDDPKAAYEEAKAIDQRLADEQMAYARSRVRTAEYHIHADGHIRGLRRVTVTRKGRQPSEVYELRINVPWSDQIKRTTISISVHGEDKAFELAIKKICDFYELPVDGDTAQAMRACQRAYLDDQDDSLAQAAGQALNKAKDKAKEELDRLTGGLLKGFKRFTA